MKPTHTHKTQGGRFAMLAHYNGDTSLDAQMIVVYRDLDREIETATTANDWEQNWKVIADDDCPLCLGSGSDPIKGNKTNPCGGCYGLGKVRIDGERPKDLWQLAEVAKRMLEQLRQQVETLEKRQALPGVAEAIQGAMVAEVGRRQDAQAEQERKWREGRGHGPGGARHTGD